MQLRNLSRSNQVLVEELQVADTMWKRLRGLLGRKQLEENEGMIIVPCNAVHTIGMAFALDLLFLARDGTVLQLEQDVRPWRMRFCLKAHAVVELPAGVLQHLPCQIGEQVVWS
ncbi:DUF192 domain-containing protein [uncultured Anaeromusa sp.]|uniref:DUF192 domain-containing protein n=1 Tax=uncultured Anaeromusa sp. TaxID=673273 RepID=UPI0029C97296|nr:DUF192 domain-containing protein [uncultured Anaeromusa sp.]